MWKKLQERFNSSESYVSMVLGLAVVVVIGMLIVNYVTRQRQKASLTENADQTTQEKQSMILPTKHLVAEEETLWAISEKYYKNGYNWVDIQKANNIINPDYIQAGQTLIIPDVLPRAEKGQTSSTGTVTPAGEEKKYTVVSGDTLWDIAVRNYNNGYKWTEIATRNNLVNPDLIHRGNVLALP